MIRLSTLRNYVLGLPEATEEPHFEKISFRVNKKIFATYDEKLQRMCIKLSEIDQSVFCAYDSSILFPVPNAWGKQGWTFVDLKNVPKAMLLDAIKTAYCEVAPKKLSILLKNR